VAESAGGGVIYSLDVYQRPVTTGGHMGNYADVAQRWQRTIAAVGGYRVGSFTLSEEDLTLAELDWFYDEYLGGQVKEQAYMQPTWEGLLYEFRYVKGGREYRRTLDPEWWHNRVKVAYTYPDTEDTEQGALTYNPAANSFQDAGQVFTDWQRLAGDATYQISVTNSDGTNAWAFLGAAFTTTNANDSVYVWTDVECATAGWNGEVTAKTPSTYAISGVATAGARQTTAWSGNTDSSGEYGEMEFLITLGGTAPELATALRDKELVECAWPRSRKLGGGSMGEGRVAPATLEVSCVGFWATLNWQYRETSRVATASALLTTLIGLTEFVTVGRIDTNNMRVKVACEPEPIRLGDAIEQIILAGDLSGNVWQGGVYDGRKFFYEAAPTTVEYYELEDGMLCDLARVPVLPPLMRPGFLLRDLSAPGGGEPTGTATAWDDPAVAYVDEVKFIAPNTLEYHLLEEEESTTALERMIERGGIMPGPHY